jgi:addiction module RelE/StbE family toxin
MEVVPTEEFKYSFKAYQARFPEIEGPLSEFSDCLTASPPLPLPTSLKDHRLKPPLSQFREFHLADDVLVLYRVYSDYIKLIIVCGHKDLNRRKFRKKVDAIK